MTAAVCRSASRRLRARLTGLPARLVRQAWRSDRHRRAHDGRATRPERQRQSAAAIAQAEELIGYLAANPTAGELIAGTGGIRKLRWRMEGRGKSGGARIIHFIRNEELPLFLLTAFAKNERADLSQAERNGFRRLTKLLVETYTRRRA